jgi:hypothetical protein
MTVVNLGRTQEYRLCEGLNLELDQIIDLPPEGKKQLLSHREHLLQSSSLVPNVDLICAVACSRHASTGRESCLPNSPWGGTQICIAVESLLEHRLGLTGRGGRLDDS